MKITNFRIVLAAALAAVTCSPAADNSGKPEPGRTNPFFAYCMDIHDAKKRTLQQQAELLKELGYEGCGHLWLDKIPERLGTLDAAGLKLFQVYIRANISADAKQPYDQRLKDVLPLFKDRNVMLAIIFEGMKPSDVSGDDRAVELIREISNMAKESGTYVALYPHAGNWVQSVSDMVRVIKKVDRPNVGAMFNLCHWMKADEGKDLKKALADIRPYLLAVSLSGSDKPEDIRAGKGNWIQPLDSGSFDIAGFIAMLKEMGYNGPVGLQCYGIGGDARDHLVKSIEAWQKYNCGK